MSNNKSRSTKPYDSSNSFVKKVASRVSGLIPRSTSWLSGWFSPPTASGEVPLERENSQNEEEQFEDALEKPPPTKRFRLTSNQEYVDTYLTNRKVNPGESSSRLVPNNFDTSAIPGPSGLGTRSSGFVASTPAVTSVDHHEPKANGDDCSESGESTSGCSSLEPQINRGLPSAQNQSRQNDSISPRKRLLDDKQNYSYLQNTRSLYLDRTSNSRNSQTVGRRNNPSFCVNTFGSPLFGERGNVNDMILNSPFYIGRTTYGGASSASYRRSIGSTSLSSSPANSEKVAKHTIKVKPGHSHPSEDTGMSQTAKRILATLEQFSTPILDAKRIPVAQEPALSSLGSRKRARGDDSGNSHLLLEQPRVPQRTPNKPLHWAKGGARTTQLTIPVVPDTLILRRREIVQDTPKNSIPSSSSNVDSYSLRTDNENSVATRNTLKMKPRLNNERETKEPEMGSQVNLPKISLPISSLPTFDISVPAPKPIVVQSPQASNAPTFGNNAMSISSTVTKAPMSVPSSSSPCLKSQDVSVDTSFSFSSPIKVSTMSKDQQLSAVNNFTFSKPLPASAKFSEPVFNCVSARPKASELKKQSDAFVGGLKPASALKTGSVMDILGKSNSDSTKNTSESTNGSVSLMEKFKPAAGTWECDKCLIRNKSDLTKCAACTNPREEKSQTTLSASSESKTTLPVSSELKNDTGFGAQFKMSQGMWECSMCMVRNKDSDVKCAACTNPKPGAAPLKPATPASNFSGWGDKFKPASNTWECSVCMVRNGPELTACQSCTTKKPGSSESAVAPIKNSWGDQFKKPEGSWSCNDCMVTNKATDLKCVACSCKKPGTESGPPSPKQNSKFSFGIAAASDKGSTTPAFSFGIPKDNKEANHGEKPNVTSSTGFKFGESKPVPSATGFTFGVPSTNTSLASEKLTTNTPPSSSAPAATPALTSTSTAFASKSTPSESKPDVSLQQPPVESNKPTFSFGVPKSSTAPAFSFGQASASAPTSQPPSTTASPIGGKRKLGDDAPSSSAPLKFGIGAGNQANPLSQVKPVFTSSSSVSSTSGPVFSFSPASHSTSSPASTLLSTSVTSTANGQNKADGPTVATTSSIFSSLVSSPTSSLSAAKPGPAFGLGVATSKDESVTSTWKLPTSTNTTSKADTKSNPDNNGASGNAKPAFTFGSNVSSSGMAFGASASAGSAAPTFAFGGSSEKTATVNKPSASFGSPASSTTIFGSTAKSLSNATSAFGSPSSAGFGILTPSANSAQPFQVTNAAAPNFNTTATSAFTSAFGTNSEEKKSGFQFNPPEGKKPEFSFSTATDEKKPTFSFGSKTEDQNKPAFSFTNTTTAQNSFQSSSASNVYAFGAPASATNGPAKSGFAFGSQTPSFSGFNSQPQSSPASFSFGAPTSSFGTGNSTAPTPSPFEGANAAPMFASPSSSFGSHFGSSNPQPSSTGFNFSASGPPNFGTQNQTSGAPTPFAFTDSQKPTFNFTSGAPVNFAAAPQDVAGAPAGRRIKKATRRTVR